MAIVTIENHRINLDQIAMVELGEGCLKLKGPGAEIIIDKASEGGIDLLLNLESERFGWLYANGHLVNPKHVVSITRTSEEHMKVNVGGVEIWIPDEEERLTFLHFGKSDPEPAEPAAA